MKFPKMQILPEFWRSGVKVLLLSQFFYYDGRVDTKCSDENSAVRDQGSGVSDRDQESKQRINIKIWIHFDLLF